MDERKKAITSFSFGHAHWFQFKSSSCKQTESIYLPCKAELVEHLLSQSVCVCVWLKEGAAEDKRRCESFFSMLPVFPPATTQQQAQRAPCLFTWHLAWLHNTLLSYLCDSLPTLFSLFRTACPQRSPFPPVILPWLRSAGQLGSTVRLCASFSPFSLFFSVCWH